MTDEALRRRLERSAAIRKTLLLLLCALGLAVATAAVFSDTVRGLFAEHPWLAVLFGVFIVLSALGFLRTGTLTSPRPIRPRPEQDPSIGGFSVDVGGEDEVEGDDRRSKE